MLDPFIGGEAQSESDLRGRLAQVIPSGKANRTHLDPYLEPATPRQIIARLLRNLKNIYTQTGKLEQTLAVMNRMLLVLRNRRKSCAIGAWSTGSWSASGPRCRTCRTTSGGGRRRPMPPKFTAKSSSSGRRRRA